MHQFPNSRDRKPEGDSGPPAYDTFDFDPSAMIGHDVPNDWQAKAYPETFRAEHRFKDIFNDFPGYPLAVINEDYFQAIVRQAGLNLEGCVRLSS